MGSEMLLVDGINIVREGFSTCRSRLAWIVADD